MSLTLLVCSNVDPKMRAHRVAMGELETYVSVQPLTLLRMTILQKPGLAEARRSNFRSEDPGFLDLDPPEAERKKTRIPDLDPGKPDKAEQAKTRKNRNSRS